MKYIALIVCVFLISACTSMQTVAVSQDQVQSKILNAESVKAGDTLRVTTRNGESHFFVVTSITNTHVKGKDIEIAIEDLAKVEVEKTSVIKTGAASIGAFYGLLFVLLAIDLAF